MAQVPNLYLRVPLGRGLSNSEIDQNVIWLKQYVDMILALFKDDGTLQNDVVTTTTVLNRAITKAKLAVDALPYYTVTNAVANDYRVTLTPAPAALVDGMVLLVKVATTNTGASTLKVGDLAAKAIEVAGSSLVGGEIRAGSVGWYVYVEANDAFELIAGSGTGSAVVGGGQIVGINKYEPVEVDVPGAGNAATFGHSFAVQPTDYRASLRCISAEFGFVAGQEVDLDEFIDATGGPAFNVAVDEVNVTVTQLAAALVGRINDGGGGQPIGQVNAITPGNWKLKVTALRTESESGNVFPAVDVQVANPDGAISYGTDLFFINFGRKSTKNFVNRLNRQTSQVFQLQNISALRYSNMAPMRLADGLDYAIFTCEQGVYRLPLQDPGGAWNVIAYSTAAGLQNQHEYKPAYIEEATPIIYAVVSHYSPSTSGAMCGGLRCRALNVATGIASQYGTDFNFLVSNFVNGAEFRAWHSVTSEVLHFQFNPVKRRIYLITVETGLLHIFEVTAAGFTNFAAWWNAGDRYTRLTYMKALGLGGGAGNWADSRKERYVIEFDLTTGAEVATTICRVGDGAKTGVVTRVPWRE